MAARATLALKAGAWVRRGRFDIRSSLAVGVISPGEPAGPPSPPVQITGATSALGAHLRDELGITDHQRARPLQAAIASVGTFAVGAALPLAVAWLSPGPVLPWSVTLASLLLLVVLGG
ncbi:MAG: VIT1/CCC1 transporter family protein [Gemmatimonadota bacterium]|nr:VIT1/CCC1 transporter family protein [Gemmatimonadota bacterium]